MGKLIIVRHGQTKMNADGLFFGKLDPELTEQGKKQAKTAREKIKSFNYDNIYSSDLKRAATTADIINYKNKEIIYDSRLQEIDFGIFEGLTYEEIKNKYPKECKQSEEDWENYNFETGESPKEMQQRAVSFIESLDLNKDNLIVTHWGIIGCILSWYLSTGLKSYWNYSVNNCGIVVIDFCDGFPVLTGLNI
ncbi:histidine phosphatase family protein [Fusobacterium hominis]|uniref:Histidine phosphatase family protein n=1 Tax=Fusobacterium hominis TaxID=2764326 RepID=A0A7G9GYY8_9FUSO|nr:histidine phosphatase family protein [Fusobacterium hominis]QNM16020.1 histidine phosphatase family protein [Fusobacterium hominis]